VKLPESALRGDPYANPELFRFVGSMEGVPEWLGPTETEEEREARSRWQAGAHRWFDAAGLLVPGIALAVALAGVGSGLSVWAGATWFGLEKSPISPILLAILLGLAVRNTIGLPAVYEVGLQLCLKRVLRIGVALLGIQLSLGAVGSIGLVAFPIIAVCIVTALWFVSRVNAAFGLPRRLGTLIAVGTAICGNTAIVATGPVIGATEDEVSYAVGCITVFGLLALVGYPFLAHAAFLGDPHQAGLFLGTAIHDTAQVVGAALLYSQQFDSPSTLEVATVTKLVRNLFMVGVIPLMAVLYHRSDAATPSTATRPALLELVPRFVFGFLALVVLRTVGDLGERPFGGAIDSADWNSVVGAVGVASTWCLTVAMASVGLGTHLRRLRNLGWKPLAVGFSAALAVGVVSAAMIHLLPWS
jgi:uncharacterized integral membrane protein (TIGR00698 family)